MSESNAPKPEIFEGMGLKNLESKISGLKCELCNKPLEAEEYQSDRTIRLGPVCRKKALTNNFGLLYDNLDDKASHAKADLLINGEKEAVYQEFFEGDFDSYEEYLAQVNSLRKTMDINADVVPMDEQLFLKMELKKLKEESHKFQPAFKALKNLGFTLQDIKNANDPQELSEHLQAKGIKFNGTDDQLSQLFFEAQDYATRQDRMALIKISLSPQEKLKQWAEKREKDYQDLFEAGFTEEEVRNTRSTTKNINTDPVLRGKALKYLKNKGAITQIPEDERTTTQVVADNLRKVNLVLKTGFWFACCVVELGCWTTDTFSGKSKPTIHIKACRKHPLKLYQEYKKKQAKIDKERTKAIKNANKEVVYKASIEEEKKQIVEQWEYLKLRRPQDISVVSRDNFLKQAKKRLA